MATATQGPEVRRVSTTPRLHGERLELLLAGIAPLLLGLAGLIVLEGPADRPELNQPPAVILSYFGEQDTVILGSFLLMLAAVAFIWFAGSLRAVLRRKEGGEGRLSTIAFGGGVAAGVFMLAWPAANSVRRAVRRAADRRAGADVLPLRGRLPVSGGDGRGRARRGDGARRAADRGAAAVGGLAEHGARAVAADPAARAGRRRAREPRPWTGLAVLPFVLLWTALIAVVLVRERDA